MDKISSKKQKFNLKYYFTLLWTFVKMNLKSQMQYKKAFFLQVFGMILNDVAFLVLWYLLYGNFKASFDIKGINFNNIVLIWAIAASSFGLMHAVFAGFRNLANIIVSGKLDNFLLYPANTLFLAGTSLSDISAWGDLIYGYIIFILFLPVNFLSFLLFTYFVIFAAIFFASVLILLSSFTFFIGNSEQIKETIFNAIISFSTYPEKFFAGPIKLMLFTFIPVGLGIYIPVRLITKFDLPLFIISSVSIFLFFLFSIFIFNKGIKKYESTSLMILG
ncbi:MAG: ABC transporter permease [Exilispira sp.]